MGQHGRGVSAHDGARERFGNAHAFDVVGDGAQQACHALLGARTVEAETHQDVDATGCERSAAVGHQGRRRVVGRALERGTASFWEDLAPERAHQAPPHAERPRGSTQREAHSRE